MKIYHAYKEMLNEEYSGSDLYGIDLYMNGTISEAEFFKNLNQLHEGVGEQLINFVGKMVTKLQGYFDDIAKHGKKLVKALGWLVEKTKGLYDKYPNLIKALVILTVMVALILLSTATFAATGEPINIDPEYLNVVIGYAKETNVDAQSLAMLIDAKDGVVDGGAGAVDWDGNEITNTFNRLRSEMAEVLNNMKSKDTTGGSGAIYTLMEMFSEMGDKLVGYSVEHSTSEDGNSVKTVYQFSSKQ